MLVEGRRRRPRDRRGALTFGAVEIRDVDPEHPDARRCIDAYFAELDPAPGMSAEPHERRLPAGVLLLACRGTRPSAAVR